MTTNLTARQLQILSFVQGYIERHGYAPSIRDIMAGCGITSTYVVTYNLDVLEREGHLTRERVIARGIVLK